MEGDDATIVSEEPSRRSRHRVRELSKSPKRRMLPIGYMGIGWMAVIVLSAILLGLIVGFVWATARDVSTLALNGREITRLNEEVLSLKRQLALASSDVPKGNWWVWWFGLPTRHLWDTIKFW